LAERNTRLLSSALIEIKRDKRWFEEVEGVKSDAITQRYLKLKKQVESPIPHSLSFYG